MYFTTPSTTISHLVLCVFACLSLSHQASLQPRTKWIGDDFNGAIPVATNIIKFVPETIEDGILVLDMFSSITCGGLRTILEGGYKIKCYTSIEIDEISRTIAR